MRFEQPLIPGRLIRRYKRFLADVELDGGRVVTAHCPNPGSMRSCNPAGAAVLLSRSSNPKRKLPYSWELVRVGRSWVCINTGRTNQIVKEALEARTVPELAEYDSVRSEVPYGQRSRVDFLLSNGAAQCYVEVKNVTLARGKTALFPDSVTQRGTRHLRELADMVQQGHRAMMFFLVNRGDCDRVAPAAEIDPVYAETLANVMKAGVEVVAYRSRVAARSVTLNKQIPFSLEWS